MDKSYWTLLLFLPLCCFNPVGWMRKQCRSERALVLVQLLSCSSRLLSLALYLYTLLYPCFTELYTGYLSHVPPVCCTVWLLSRCHLLPLTRWFLIFLFESSGQAWACDSDWRGSCIRRCWWWCCSMLTGKNCIYLQKSPTKLDSFCWWSHEQKCFPVALFSASGCQGFQDLFKKPFQSMPRASVCFE